MKSIYALFSSNEKRSSFSDFTDVAMDFSSMNHIRGGGEPDREMDPIIIEDPE